VGAAYAPHPSGYANATELAAGVARIYPFELSVGCYPEKHPESPSLAHDIDVLKAKVDAGATRAISQFFFDVDAFLRYVDKVRAAGIAIPVIPGVMPVTNFAGLKRMAAACGTYIPPRLAELFEGLDEDVETRRMVATSVAAEICGRLKSEGFQDFHFYTLNRPELVYAICRLLGVREPGAAEPVLA
jgi:methylenetetrahydrofolate reductase (NADPH)